MFEVSAPIVTTTGTEVPTLPAPSGTRTRSAAAVADTTGASTDPNRTLAPRPQSVPASVTSSPGMATLGETPWMRGVW